MALRGNQLVTTQTPGAPQLVAEGYTRGGGTPRLLKKGESPQPEWPVIIFTNSKMQEDLDETKPGWRKRGWMIIHNPKEAIEAGKFARIIAAERGTPLPDGGE